MATYTELFALATGSTPEANALRDRVAIAVSIAAEGFLTDAASTAVQRTWAYRVAADPRAMANVVWPLVLAANAGFTEAQILGASDAAIQTNVDAVAVALADGLPV